MCIACCNAVGHGSANNSNDDSETAWLRYASLALFCRDSPLIGAGVVRIFEKGGGLVTQQPVSASASNLTNRMADEIEQGPIRGGASSVSHQTPARTKKQLID